LPERGHDKLLGLALGGGAARGLAHLGVLQALESRGIRPDLVVGTSAGAVVGALYCAGMSPEEMMRLAARTRWRHLVDIRPTRYSVLDIAALEEKVADWLNHCTFDDLRIPFACTAVDLVTARQVILSQGDVARAVRASCAVPGIFAPVISGDQVLVDGGVYNNVPVSVCRQLGAKVVVAVDLHGTNQMGYRPQNMFEVIMVSWDIIHHTRSRDELSLADVVVEPQTQRWSVVSLDKLEEFVIAGRQAAERVMDQLVAALQRVKLSAVPPDSPCDA